MIIKQLIAATCFDSC